MLQHIIEPGCKTAWGPEIAALFQEHARWRVERRAVSPHIERFSRSTM